MEVGWADFLPLAPFRMTISSESFLRYEAERMVTADRDLWLLTCARHWFVDGTFKVYLAEYVQLYSLHADHEGMFCPCVYALLPGKSQELYNKLLGKVLSIIPDDTIPNLACHDILRKQQLMPSLHISLKLMLMVVISISQHGEEFNDWVCLPLLVPPAQVHDCMAMVAADETPRRDGMLEFIRYFQDTHVGQRINNQVHIRGQANEHGRERSAAD